MLSKTMTYVDYNGVERKETFYFNLSKAELMQMQLGTTGGLSDKLQKIIDTKDGVAIINFFKDLVLKAYGEKSEDGKYFRKSKEISESFSQTEAYSDLFMSLAMDANAAAEFVNGIIPKDLAEQAAAAQHSN